MKIKYEPRFIREYLPDGDYKLVPNPKCSLLNCRPSKPRSIRSSGGSVWAKIGNLLPPNRREKRKKFKADPYWNKCSNELSALERELIAFKARAEQMSYEERLAALRSKAEERFEFQVHGYKLRRQLHDKSKGQWFIKWKKCFLCRIQPVQNIHHIIEVQNGGTNDEANLVGLCRQCHAEIHPWLKKSS